MNEHLLPVHPLLNIGCNSPQQKIAAVSRNLLFIDSLEDKLPLLLHLICHKISLNNLTFWINHQKIDHPQRVNISLS